MIIDVAPSQPQDTAFAMLDVMRRADLMENILRSSSDCIKVLDLDANLIFMSEGGQRVMEIDDVQRFIGCPWPDFWQGEGNVAARFAVAEARAGRHASFQGFARTAKGRDRWWDVAVNPIFDAGGAVVQILSISRDITDLKEAQARQRLLMEELTHRVKNSLTMVKAIAGQTFRDASDPAMVRAFDTRIMALASAHDLLMQEDFAAAPIRAVVEAALKLHSGGVAQLVAAGPDVTLGPRTALYLALLLNELATNATKYGALSTPSGQIDIAWRVEDDATLTLDWRESGGPAVEAPRRKGFGSRLIGIGLGSGLADVRYLPEGLAATFSAPMNQIDR